MSTFDLEFFLNSSWSSILSWGPIVYDSISLDSIFSSNIMVISNYDLSPLDYDLGCTDYNSIAFGDFGDLRGEAS